MKKSYSIRLANGQERKRLNRKCPRCGQMTFVPYVHADTGHAVDDHECGRCNRECKCQYHLPPKEWYALHQPKPQQWLDLDQWKALQRERQRQQREAQRAWEQKRQEEARKRPPFNPYSMVQAPHIVHYLQHLTALCLRLQGTNSVLGNWLIGQFGKERVEAVFERYYVGATPDGATVYWQLDHHGRMRAGKVMLYGPDGHRAKHVRRAVTWVNCMPEYGCMERPVPLCLFGEHLLMDSDRPIALVESEKTALIMAIVAPQYTWLATGGKGNASDKMMWPLAGERVMVLPDSDAIEGWRERLQTINREYGTRMYIPPEYLHMMSRVQEPAKGLDVADMYFMREEYELKRFF